MASELGWVGLGVAPDFSGFKGKVDRESSKVMAAAGVSGGTAFGESAGKSAGAKFKSVIKSAAKVAAVGFAAAGALAIKFGGDALDEAREAQKVGALTTSTIKATGGAAKVTAKHVGALSEKISEQAGIDDEVIQRGANMLLTFKNVRNEAGKGGKIFDRTTRAITDMAAGMAGGKGGEIDLKSASILMGKALNDPVKGLTALNRVGVQFSDQQKAINTALVEGGEVNALNALGLKVTTAEFADAMEKHKRTAEEQAAILTGPLSDAQQKWFDHLTEGGHTLEAQQNILKEVNSQFKGAAAAQATDAEKLSVAWGNFKEEVGTELLPVMDDLANFLRTKGIDAAKEFFGWIKREAVPAGKDLYDRLKPIAHDALPAFKDALKTAKGVAKGAAPIIEGLFEGFNKMPDDLRNLLLVAGGTAAVGKKLGLFSGKGLIGGLVSKAKPMPVFVTNPGFGGGVGGGKGIPPVVPGCAPGAAASTIGKFPWWAKFIPVGLGSAPGQSSALQQLTGTGSKAPPGTVPVTIDGETVFLKDDRLDATADKMNGLVDSTNRFKGALDLVGAKKVNPDLRIPAMMQEQNRLSSFHDELDLVGHTKIRPGVQLQGVAQARSDLAQLAADMRTVAAFDPTGLSGLAAAGVGAASRNRRRNLGGMP